MRDQSASHSAAPGHSPAKSPQLSKESKELGGSDDMNRYAVFCAPKAGMKTVDTKHVNSVVYEMSRNSKHFANSQRLAQRVSTKIEAMKKTMHEVKSMPLPQQRALQQRAQALMDSLESQRDLTKTWCHIDLDAFYASVEIRDRPELAIKPVAVGSLSMISTANYIARAFGVRSAMPGFIAMKLCPQLVLVSCNFEKYEKAAAIFRPIFAEFDSNFESASLDEAYLDLTACIAARFNARGISCPVFEAPELRNQIAAEIATEIRERVYSSTGLTCSAGIGPNRMLAKICTDINKPNGQFILPASIESVLSFIDHLNVRKIPGIGKVMERVLNEIGITEVGQIRSQEFAPMLLTMFSEISYQWLFRVSLGLSRTEHDSEEEPRRKSISTERTFRNISSCRDLERKVQEIARSLARDVEEKQLRGKTLTLKMKDSAFEVKQRSSTQSTFIHSYDDFHRIGLSLLREELAHLAAVRQRELNPVLPTQDGLLELRLMGLRLSALDNQSESQSSAVNHGSILQFAVKLSEDDDDCVELEQHEQHSKSQLVQSATVIESAPPVKRRRIDQASSGITRFFAVRCQNSFTDDESDSELCLIEQPTTNSAAASQSQRKPRSSDPRSFFFSKPSHPTRSQPPSNEIVLDDSDDELCSTEQSKSLVIPVVEATARRRSASSSIESFFKHEQQRPKRQDESSDDDMCEIDQVSNMRSLQETANLSTHSRADRLASNSPIDLRIDRGVHSASSHSAAKNMCALKRGRLSNTKSSQSIDAFIKRIGHT